MERIAKIAIQASTGYEGLPVPSDSDRQLSLVTKEPSTDEAHPADILAPGKTMSFESHAFPDEALGYLPFIANHPFSSSARLTPRHFVCLTIGSRGDVQPYIALALRLKADQHRVTIVTHSEISLDPANVQANFENGSRVTVSNTGRRVAIPLL